LKLPDVKKYSVAGTTPLATGRRKHRWLAVEKERGPKVINKGLKYRTAGSSSSN